MRQPTCHNPCHFICPRCHTDDALEVRGTMRFREALLVSSKNGSSLDLSESKGHEIRPDTICCHGCNYIGPLVEFSIEPSRDGSGGTARPVH